MNADQLLAHYEQIADAPDAISRLRRFILDLAVRGKLVEQDPADEPASELLKQIAAEKARLVKVGEIRKPKKLSAIDTTKLFFDPPSGWAWSRLLEISRKIHYGFTASANKTIEAVRLLRITDIQNNRVDWLSVPGCEIEKSTLPQYVLEKGDVLIARTGGTIGKSFLVQEVPVTAVFASYLIRVQGAHEIYDRYLKLFLESPTYWTQLQDGARGAGQPNVNGQTLGKLLVPLPPLAEQHRIVAKVDELMGLCDRLEAARTAREATRDRLTAASLARLTALDTDTEVFPTHARFALDALPALTARPDQIKQLRQTILNLAVRSKLVEQDPGDEPASELLNIISKTRKRLYSEKKIPKPKPLPQIDEMDLPFDVPPGWAWSMLGQLCYQVADGPHFSPQYVPPERGIPFLSTRNVRPDGFDLSSMKYVSQADHEEFCKRIKPEPNDILYTKGGTTGIAKVNDLDFEFSVWVHLAVLRIEKERLFPRYIELALNSPHCYAQSQEYTRGISNFDLGLTRMIKITIPLPPLAEQHRIVAKVDALMALCDRLEAALATADTTRQRLLEALLHEALTPGEEQEAAA
jgi:type I restriction enzyme, S subunit